MCGNKPKHSYDLVKFDLLSKFVIIRPEKKISAMTLNFFGHFLLLSLVKYVLKRP